MTARWGYPRRDGEMAWIGIPYATEPRSPQPDPVPLRTVLAEFRVAFLTKRP